MPDDNLAFRDTSRTIYVVSCALIASSIAQWQHGGLSMFDGIMSTMLTTFMAIFVTINYRYIQTLGVSVQIASFLFTSLWCYWGIQVWSASSTFGLEPFENIPIADCTANIDTVMVVFGKSISATNNGIRIFALLVFSAFGGVLSIVSAWTVIENLWKYYKYGAAETKVHNVEVTVILEMQSEYGYDLGPSGDGITRVSRFGGFIGFLCLVYLIIMTELTVARNPSVRDDLSKWTYGQTLGVIMIGQQLLDIWNVIHEQGKYTYKPQAKSSDAEKAGR